MTAQGLIVAAGALGLALMVSGGAQAQSNDEKIVASCKAELQMTDAGCGCLLDKVHAELSEGQQSFLVAAISNDTAGQQSAMQQLSGEEMLELTTFMTSAPQSCGGL